MAYEMLLGKSPFKDDIIKIGDFGCSVFTQDERNTIVGTLPYYSPEQLKQGFYD